MEKKINTALCSFGMSGLLFHAPFLEANPHFNLYAVWERSAKTAADIYPHIISFDDYDEMLADKSIDLVIVNTPNYTHFDFAAKALKAGKHVMVEKAFTVDVAEAEALINIASQAGKLLAVFQNRRYDSDFKTVKKIIDEGLLGNIIEAEIHFDRFKPVLSPKQHKETNNAGAGLLHDLGPHIIDQCLYLFGMPETVFGITRITRPHSVVNDFVDISLFYKTFYVRLKSSLFVKELLPAYIFHGTSGSFIKWRADIQEDVLKAGAIPGSAGWGTEPTSGWGNLNIINGKEECRSQIPSLQGNYMELYDGLYKAILHGKDLPVTAADGLNVMKIIAAVQRSAAEGKIIPL